MIITSFTKVFLGVLGLKILAQLYLSLRNQINVEKHSPAVPEKFQDKINLEDHQKAARYTIAKSKFGRFSLFLDTAILLIWTIGGGLNLLDQWVYTFHLSPILTGVAFMGLFSLINMVIDLPESIYQTFNIEQKFGFNRTTPKIFLTDLVKQLVIGAIIGLPLIAALMWIMNRLGQYWWLYAWITLSLFQLLMMWLYPSVIAPLFNKFQPLEEGEQKDAIVELLKKINFSYKGLYVMDASKRSTHGNAYFTGFGNNKRIVFFDTLLKTLAPQEVQAVLAHELGHFKKKHILKSMIISFLFSLIGLYVLGQLKDANWFYHSLGITRPSTHAALLLFMIVVPIFTYFITPVMSWFSRKNEFEADAFAAANSDAKELINALVKMYKDNASTLTPDPLFSAFYHSHPPALIRIQHLESLLEKS